MKLGKLLAAGKSIMSGRTDVSYRSSKQVYLPKFGSAKNPFKPEAGQVAEEAPSSPVMPRPTRAANPELQAAAPIGDGAADEKMAAFSAIKQKKNKIWAPKFNLVSAFRTALPKRAVRSLAGADKTQDNTVMQTELSLDSVKVVHNDLSDVDVEVVPMKSRAMASEPQPAKKPLEFWGERLFGVEAT